ncbi:MAG: hypothetical protein HUJ94_04825 [Bacteroidales bacterium]|nr:hypothetical protein [Bacteroidales bacterium]
MNGRFTKFLTFLLVLVLCGLAVGVWLLYRDVPGSGSFAFRTEKPADLGVPTEAETGIVDGYAPEDSVEYATAESQDEVAVSQGPFKVKNMATGKMDDFGMANGCLYMKEDGVFIWQHNFEGQFCGNVESVDFYNNSKLQYLFASGSSLHLYDRLGNVVKGFPVMLPKPVLLGPVSAGKGRFLFVHADNSIEMYGLDGAKTEGWLGISPSSKVISMPVLDGQQWLMATESGEERYPLLGGEKI